MKKFIFSLSALFAFGLASAQETTTSEGFKAGDAFISGTVSYGTQKTGDQKIDQFNFVPSVGYFFTDKVAAGINLLYTTGKDNSTGYDVKTNTFGVGVFGRYYFTTGSKFNIFGQLDVAYSTGKREYDGGTLDDYKENSFGAGVSPGFNYWLNNHFALESSIGFINYTSTKPDVPGAEKTNRFDIGVDMANVNFGLLYKF